MESMLLFHLAFGIWLGRGMEGRGAGGDSLAAGK